MDEQAHHTPLPAALYSVRILYAYLELFAERYPTVPAHEVLRAAGIAPHEVADPGHWLTQEQVNRFHERAVALTGNPHIAREGGRFAASSRALGRLREWGLGQLGPTRAYLMIGSASSRMTRASRVTARRLGPGAVEIVSVNHPGVEEERFQCDNRAGLLQAVGLFFNIDPQLEHPECLFEGGSCCRYVLRWRPTASERWRVVSLWATAAMVAGLAVAAPWLSANAAVIAVLGGLLGVGVLRHRLARAELGELRALVGDIRATADKSLDAISHDYEDALLVHDIGLALSRPTDPRLGVAGVTADRGLDFVLRSTMRVIERNLGYDRGLVWLHDATSGRLVCRASYGLDPEQERILAGLALAVDDPTDLVTACFASQHSASSEVAPAPSHESASATHWVTRIGARSLIVCPITYEEAPLGVLYVDRTSPGPPLMQRNMNLLTGVAPTLAVSIHSALLAAEKAQAERAAHTDALTGVENRRGLEARLGARWASHVAQLGGFAVLFIDIDRFKAVNDTFGHAVGDGVLVELTGELQRLCRGADVVGRWGGEEFLVLLGDADDDGTLRAAERIRAAVQAHPFAALGGGTLTVSVGGALVTPADLGPADVLARADAAMYEAKAAGRNRAVLRREGGPDEGGQGGGATRPAEG